MSLFKTLDRILVAIEYTKTAEGAWRADFRGFADLTAEARNLEECRRAILDEVDLRLVALVTPRAG